MDKGRRRDVATMRQFFKILKLAFITLLVFFVSGSPKALASFENPSIYEQLSWPQYVALGSTSISCGPNGTISGSNGSTDLDAFLRALAYQENGGNPTGGTPGYATGKYQYEVPTWHGSAKSYYLPADKYAEAQDAPEAVQDAVAYIEYTVTSIKLKGDVAKMAVHHIYPAVENDPSVWPTFKAGAASNPTAQQYADSVINILKSGKASSIPMKENDAPDFKTYLAKAGNPAPLTISAGSGAQASTCGTCNIGELNTAMSYAWPTYHAAPYTDFEPAYQTAVSDAQTKGVYVGGDQKPGMDCGGFVTLVMRNSGADPNYNDKAGPTTVQQQYLEDHPELYQKIGQKTDTKDLQPGDIGINSEHTFIYAGDRGFPNFNAISASVCGSSNSCRAPMASTAYFSNSAGMFTFYRLKCSTTGG